jgi:hypothetical protein
MIIIVATIVTFVYWGSNRPGGGGGQNYAGSIEGHIITRQALNEAAAEVRLRYFVMTGGRWPDTDSRRSGFDLTQQTYSWLFFQQKLRDYNIQVSTTAVAEEANRLLTEFGGGRPLSLDDLMKVLGPNRITVDDFERYIRHDLAMRQLVSIVGISSKMILPSEAQAFYAREYRDYSTEAVFFNASNYLASVPTVTTQALAAYFSQNQALFRVPAQVQVSYVAFPITNYMPRTAEALSNVTENVEQAMIQLGTNYAAYGATPAAARAAIHERIARQMATQEASTHANTLLNDAISIEPFLASNLATVASTSHLAVVVSKPFSQETGPTEFDGGPNFGNVAFALNAEQPIAEQSLVGDQAVYAIALERQIPSYIPPLEEIRSKVADQMRWAEAMKLARKAGEDFVQTATNGLAQGKAFSALCSAATLSPVHVPPFSLSTRSLPGLEDRVDLPEYKQAAASTRVGQISRLVPTQTGGYAVYVQRILPVDEEKMKKEFPAYLASLQRALEQRALEHWQSQQLQSTPMDIPLGRNGENGASESAPE